MTKKSRKRANGEGSLRERADKTWEATITIGRDREGNLIRKSFYGKTQGIAKEKRDKFLTENRTGMYIEPNKIYFGDWVTSWLNLFVKPNVRQSTYSKYVTNFRNHIENDIGKIELQKLDIDILQKFYNQKKENLSSSVIAILHQVISGALKHAIRRKMIRENPAQYTTRPSVTHKEIQPLTAEELNIYLASAKPHRYYTAFLLCLTTGLRRGELLALRWSDVNMDTGIINVKESLGRIELEKGSTKLVFDEVKTENSKRDIPLLPSVIQELVTLKSRQEEEQNVLGKGYNGNNLVFCTSIGTPIEPRALLRHHKEILKNAGLRDEITIHTLRHTFGTMLIQAGENPRNLQLLLGHADIRTTLGTYTHSTIEDKRRTVSVLSKIIEPSQR